MTPRSFVEWNCCCCCCCWWWQQQAVAKRCCKFIFAKKIWSQQLFFFNPYHLQKHSNQLITPTNYCNCVDILVIVVDVVANWVKWLLNILKISISSNNLMQKQLSSSRLIVRRKTFLRSYFASQSSTIITQSVSEI